MDAGARPAEGKIMRSSLPRRLAGAAAGIFIVGSLLLSTTSGVLAGETRNLFVGSVTNGELVFSPVTAGNATVTSVTIKNIGKQNLTDGHFVIGQGAAGALDSNIKVVAVFGASSGVVCPAITEPVSTLDCSLGSITAKPSGNTRSLNVVFSVATAGSFNIQVAVKVSETGSDVGSNANFKAASGSLDVGVTSCDQEGNFYAAHSDETTDVVPSTACTNDIQRSSLVVKGRGNLGNALFVNDTTAATDCPEPFVCFGNAVDGRVNGGDTVTPYVLWQIFYTNEALGSINPNKVAFRHDATTIVAGKKGLCATDLSVDCQEPFVTTSAGTLFIIRTGSNGLVKGMH
jgi:hypothetical protein